MPLDTSAVKYIRVTVGVFLSAETWQLERGASEDTL